ncbi:MAG TPA: hypothetical protein VIE43_04980 [Thermoanaerobaculia bacterium]|jgi:hypothetical protein|nr:hypothetical protein [Thermoanaerobaculia bacterium]
MGRLAFLIALVALVLSWAAYRRAGGELKDVVTDVTRGAPAFHLGSLGDGGPAGIDREADLSRAEGRLLQHRAEVAGDKNLAQVERDVADIRHSLDRSYENASEVARSRWRGLDAELNRLEVQLRQGGSKALASLDAAVSKLRDAAGEEKKDGR